MKPFDPLDKIDYVQDTIVSEVLFSNEDKSITVLALDSGTELSTHTSPQDDVVFILEGDLEINTENDKFNLSTGEMIIIKKDTPHSATADKRTKLLLIRV